MSANEHISEQKIAELVNLYEAECKRGAAQGQLAKGTLKAIQTALNYSGCDYDTITLARYGSERAKDYIRRGVIDNYSLNNQGEIVGSDGRIVAPYWSN